MKSKISNNLIKLNDIYISEIDTLLHMKKSTKFKNYIKVLKNGFLVDAIKYAFIKLNKTNYDNLINKTEPSVIINKGCKVVVYSCITGGYDDIEDPLFVNPNIDYILYSDNDNIKSDVWTIRNIDDVIETNELVNSQKNRYIKIHPHKLFSEYDYSIYIDGNILVIGDLYHIIQEMGPNIIGLHRHSGRTCVYDEAISVICLGKDKKSEVRKQMKQYKKEGFPKNFGLFENNFIVRRHNNKMCIKLMEDWWEQLNKYTWRDQLSLMYCFWKSEISLDSVFILGNNVKKNPIIKYLKHR